MSGPMRLNAVQVRDLASALDGITRVTRDTGVRFDAYASLDVRVVDATVSVRWDETDEEYVIDDRVGT